MTMGDESKIENEVGYAYKCSGVSIFPSKSMYDEMCARLDDDEIEIYKKIVERYYDGSLFKFPWDDD